MRRSPMYMPRHRAHVSVHRDQTLADRLGRARPLLNGAGEEQARDDTSGDRQNVHLGALQALGTNVIKGSFSIRAEEILVLTGPDDIKSVLSGFDRQLIQITHKKGSDVNMATQLLPDYLTDSVRWMQASSSPTTLTWRPR